MFTGLIEGLGKLTGVRPSGQGRELSVTADFDLVGTRIGDSLCVSGACLTVVRLRGRRFDVDVSPETVEKTSLAMARPGDRVNLERAMRLSDRLDGHLVSGHVDGVGRIADITTQDNALRVRIEIPAELSRYTIPKGSVAVDGISLTINRCGEGWLEVAVIPHTATVTTLGFKALGDPVNIETDMIGKYVERFVRQGRQPSDTADSRRSVLDLEFLAKSGYL